MHEVAFVQPTYPRSVVFGTVRMGCGTPDAPSSLTTAPVPKPNEPVAPAASHVAVVGHAIPTSRVVPGTTCWVPGVPVATANGTIAPWFPGVQPTMSQTSLVGQAIPAPNPRDGIGTAVPGAPLPGAIGTMA